MASTVYFLIFSGFVFAITQSVTTETSKDLKCACNICKESQNNTCITDGLCFTELIKKDGQISYSYSCLDKAQFLPPEEIPFICRDQRFGVSCCYHDYCNQAPPPTETRKCECNICEESQNNTCITDGICFTQVIQKDGQISYSYGCLNKVQFLTPDEIPLMCRDPMYGVQCCFDDYCNKDLQPTLPTESTEVNSGGFLDRKVCSDFCSPKLGVILLGTICFCAKH